ncbi:MAG: hypothetical protein JSS76_12720 [Bacteroidetes bacterium]|nr:hypothetical protein [Bacteroidota bacterium]
MKKITSFLMAGALVAALMTTSSCSKTCDAGYEGSDCKTEMRAKFINEPNGWLTAETGTQSAPAAFTVHIQSSSTGVDQIRILNFWNAFTNAVTAKMTSSTTFTIPNQSPDNDGYTVISGTGTINNGIISVSYSVTDTSNRTDAVTGTWTKN